MMLMSSMILFLPSLKSARTTQITSFLVVCVSAMKSCEQKLVVQPIHQTQLTPLHLNWSLVIVEMFVYDCSSDM